MSKIRINDLARELEVKSKAILDVLTEVGVTEKKTHSSSLEEHEAEKVRVHFRGTGETHAASKPAARSGYAQPDEIRTKIDLSHISKPGDVLKAIIGKQQQTAAPPPPPPAPPRPVTPPTPPARPLQEAKPAAPPPAAPKPPAPAPSVAPPPSPAPPPRVITPPAPPKPVAPAPSAPAPI